MIIERHLHWHRRIAQRTDVAVKILFQQQQSIESEENRGVPAQRRGCRRQNEGRVGPVQRPLGGNDGHGWGPGVFDGLQFGR